ncbi:MAG: hypothetical protein JRC68_08305 [Deltaproteobacteria bacterium]|nr:hypothetical protein [Deltaproteobacteria bacterium]
MNDPQYTVEALSGLRDSALILAVANEYLCADQYLVKIGSNIDKDIRKLKEDISSLKKQFPGKLVNEVDTDEILKKIRSTAQTMMEPGNEVRESCVKGELGSELESDIKTIANAVNLIRNQVEGRIVTYTRKDSVSHLVGGLTDVGRSMKDAAVLGLKILFCLILISILGFAYLYFTMEKEGVLLKEVAGSEINIQLQQEIISQLDDKKERISLEIKSMENKVLSRDEKIMLLDKDMDIHKINEDRRKAEIEISTHEQKIMSNRKKVEDIQSKSFLKRLFRQ